MRVLHISKTYYPDTYGGMEQCIYHLCEGCIKSEVKSEVFTLSPNAKAHRMTIGHHTVNRAKLDFKIASTSISLSAHEQYLYLLNACDIVHYHFPWPFADILHLTSKFSKPSIVTYHSDIIRQKYLNKVYRPIRNRFLESVDCIVATSPNYSQTSDVLHRHRHKVRTIPIGIDRAGYPRAASERLSKWRQCLPDRFFLFIGATRYYKGLHILLQALEKAEFPLVILGGGPEETGLKTHALRFKMNNVHFLGPLPDEDKCALLELSYAVVLPSHLRSEAFGISLIEGAMYGKPLISTEIGTGTTYINIAGETGYVVPPNNPDALRTAMRALWDNPHTAATMGKAAEARYQDLFTSDRMVRSYIDVYREVSGG